MVNIIEIGCGFGALASILKKEERFNYIGFEPNKVRAEFCMEHELNVIKGFFHPEFIGGKVDVVVFDNVLEHVFKPIKLIDNAISVLKKNGILIIIVPNLFDIRQYITYWRNRNHWQPNCHINYFCLKDLKRVFKDYNLKMKPFDISLLDFDQYKDLLYVPKLLCDKIGLYFMGLSVYGIKNS